MPSREESGGRRLGPMERLARVITRRGVLRGAGAVGVGVVLGRRDALALRAAAQAVPDVRAILDAAITGEALAVTVIGVARQRGVEGRLGLGTELLGFLRAAQCEEEAHYHFLAFAGATPATTAFTVPEAALVDRDALLRAVVDLEGIAVAAYMAAARGLAAAGDPRLVEVAYQIGAVEGGHLALARYLLGERPANDRAFARRRFADVADSVAALGEAGYIGGTGEAVEYPGPVGRYCRGVFGLVPETTDDALATAPPATPVAGFPGAPPAIDATPGAGDGPAGD